MDSIEIDETALPLLRITFNGVPSDAQFDAYLARLEANLDRCERSNTRCAMLFDATKAGLVSASIRRKQAEWMQKHQARSARYCVGYAFIISSSLVRGALTAILWLAPMPAPHRVVGTVGEGEAWLRDLLGVSVTRVA